MRTRLAAVLFLEYAVQGLWAVPLAAFLMGSPHEGGLNMAAGPLALIYATMAIGAVVTPLLVGLLCDRLFPVQRTLAFLHLLGAGILGVALWWSVTAREFAYLTFVDVAKGTFVTARHIVHLQSGDSDQPYRTNLLAAMAELEGIEHPKSKPWYLDPLKRATPFRWHRYLEPARPREFDPYAWVREGQRTRYTPEQLQEYVGYLRGEIDNGIRRVRVHPDVVAASDFTFPPLFGLMLAYACVYLPTIALSNVVAFRNLPDPGRQYGRFRALGTLGWIAAGLFVGFAAPAVSALCFLFAAIASGVLAVLCLLLPHTPPTAQPKSVADALGLPAFRMLAERPFLVYVLTAFVATALMAFHNVYTNKFLVDLHVDHPAAVQTLAQPTEILGAILIPWVWLRLGTKWMLCLGLLASAGRFGMYATESMPGVVGLGLPLHGIGFALFYIAAALYVDREAPADLRASAQGLVTLLTLGVGGVIGNWFAGQVVEFHTAGGVVDWRAVWLVPAAGTLAAAVAFAAFFRDGSSVRGASQKRGSLLRFCEASRTDKIS
ncbi:MAG TPA: MFS transporter [Gemmataceae bacterium]|jgi:nucleoside transporter|nr:MFS transporter [Gemmataceae bacterium]